MRYATWLRRWEKLAKWPEKATVVGIVWRDASHAEDSDNAGSILSFTVGTLLSATKEELSLAMEVFDNGNDRDVTTIPASLILKVLPFLHAPLFEKKK